MNWSSTFLAALGFIFGNFVQAAWANEKPEIVIQNNSSDDNCLAISLVEDEQKTARYDSCYLGTSTSIRTELFADKSGRKYVLVEYIAPSLDQADRSAGTGRHLLVLRPDKERLLKIAEIPLSDAEHENYAWKSASEKTDGLEIILAPSTSKNISPLIARSIWIEPQISSPKKHGNDPLKTELKSAYEAQLIQLGGQYGSVPPGEGWCGEYNRRDSVTLAVTDKGAPIAETKICPGYGTTAAEAHTIRDNTDETYVVLDWKRRGTGPHDNLTIYHLKQQQLSPVINIELSAEEVYGTNYSSSYGIEANPTRGLKVTIQGKVYPGPKCVSDCAPTEKFRTIWINPQ